MTVARFSAFGSKSLLVEECKHSERQSKTVNFVPAAVLLLHQFPFFVFSCHRHGPTQCVMLESLSTAELISFLNLSPDQAHI